jgi:hypothetical protein
MKHSNLYFGLVLPSGGLQSLILGNGTARFKECKQLFALT